MQVFKTTLRIILRSPLYLLIYIVGFGLLGLLMGVSLFEIRPFQSIQLNRNDLRPAIAVIDRDGSPVSEGLIEFLTERSTPVHLEDTVRALQEASAQNQASYILIIPKRFGEDFLKAARSNRTAPLLETVTNYSVTDAMLMEIITNRYLQALRVSAALNPEATTAALLKTTARVANQQVTSEAAPLEETSGASQGSAFFFLWMVFPLTLGLIALSGVTFATFRQGELRRRNLSSPLSASKVNRQISLGSLSFVAAAWLFMILLTLLPAIRGLDILLNNPATFAFLALATLVYAFVPFTLGFLLSQFGLKEAALNGAANIIALAFCFLSGIFMGGAHMLGTQMQTVAKLLPAYWYSEAILSLVEGGTGRAVLMSYFSNLGIVVLFALAFFSIALLIGKRSAQSADGGGNTAAEAAV